MDDTQSAQILQMQNRHYTYIIMKVMYSPGHHQNDFVETQALGCMICIICICNNMIESVQTARLVEHNMIGKIKNNSS